MIGIGNFFFKYRNYLFIFLYLALFIPSPPLFNEEKFGDRYYLIPIISGLFITILGQLIRGITIGLAYIIRGGKNKQVYAEALVTEGMFNHCRNPLYLGNILMLAGVGILSNSLIYVGILIPVFLFIYQAIVLAEENFLRNKFGEAYTTYCKQVNRWLPSLQGIGATFRSMEFKWKRWILKEYNTQYVWMTGIVLVIFLTYPQLTDYDTAYRNKLIIILLVVLILWYAMIRFLKKTGRMQEE